MKIGRRGGPRGRIQERQKRKRRRSPRPHPNYAGQAQHIFYPCVHIVTKNAKTWTGSRWSVYFCYLLFQDSVDWDKILQRTFRKEDKREDAFIKKQTNKNSPTNIFRSQTMSAPHKHSFTPFYTPKTRFLLSAVRKCHVFLGGKKYIRNSSRRTLMCQHILMLCVFFVLFFFSLNWAAKVHEPLANLAAHECRVSFLQVRGILGVRCAHVACCAWQGWRRAEKVWALCYQTPPQVRLACTVHKNTIWTVFKNTLKLTPLRVFFGLLFGIVSILEVFPKWFC